MLRRGVRELEEAELDRAFREGGVEVEAMVAAGVVMVVPAVVALRLVPDVRQLLHRLGLLLVEPPQEIIAHRLAVVPDAVPVDAHGGDHEALVARHQVRECAEGLRRVAVLPDVDVDFMRSFA